MVHERLDVERSDVPFEYLTDVGEVHLDTVLILVGVKIHLGELAGLLQFIDGCKKAPLILEEKREIWAYSSGRVAEPRGGWRIQCTWRVHTH